MFNLAPHAAMHRLFALLLLLLAFFEPTGAQTPVSGKLIGSDGSPMPVGHIEVSPYQGRRALQVIQVEEDGVYQLDLPYVGLYRLLFCGPLHRAHEVIVYAEDLNPIEIDVQLQRIWLDPDQSYTRVTTASTNFDYDKGVAWEELSDATYAAQVYSVRDTMMYELPGVHIRDYAGLILKDLTADTFQYKGRGEYYPIVANPEGEVRVVLEAERHGQEKPPSPHVTFGPNNPHPSMVWDYLQRLRDVDMAFYPPMRSGRVDEEALRKAEKDRQNALRFELLALEADIDREEDAFQRELLLFFYLSRASGFRYWWYRNASAYRSMMMGEGSVGVSSDVIDEVVHQIPSTSLLWIMHPVLLQVMVEHSKASQAVVDYVESVINEHPNEGVRQAALRNLVHGTYAREGLSESFMSYMERYAQEFDDETFQRTLPLAKNLKVAPGRRAPEIRPPRFGGDATISSDSLKGKITLLNFTTSWCEPCGEDNQALEKAHGLYNEQGLEILNVVLDVSVGPNKKQTTSPVFVGRMIDGRDGFNSPLAISYEVTSVPHRVLLDRDLVVLAVGGELFDDALLEVLKKAFQP